MRGGKDEEAEAGVRHSYDTLAERYADELGDELTGKPLDRALLAVLAESVAAVPGRLPVSDVGCGPGHVTGYLADLVADRDVPVVGVDLSPAMVAEASRRNPGIPFLAASMLDLPVPDAAWSGVVCAYAVIHLTAERRAAAYAELARAVVPGGWLLLSFHVAAADLAPGSTRHVDELFGLPVDLDFHFLDPAEVLAGLTAAGWEPQARLDREPVPDVEYPSRRCSLLLRRAQDRISGTTTAATPTSTSSPR